MPVNPKQKLQREKRDKEILKLYPDLTFEEISKRYKLSRERIRQILNKSLKVAARKSGETKKITQQKLK